MEYLSLDITVNPWEGRSFEVIARGENDSARQVVHFPLSQSALNGRLPPLRRALAQLDLAAAHSGSEDERAVAEFAGLLYRFVFSGEVQRVFNEARAAAVTRWKGLRLRLRISAPELQTLPWEVLWDILAFDLHSLRRGLFDLRVERVAPSRGAPPTRPAAAPLHPLSLSGQHPRASELHHLADAAYYASNFAQAVELYRAGLRLAPGPGAGQALECLARAEECLVNLSPASTVPPRAAEGYRRAWESYTTYRFNEALRWLDEAWLLAKDWGIAEWPEAKALRARIERAQTGYENYLEALARRAAGDLQGALEALEQALRSDPLEIYRAQLETWTRAQSSGLRTP